MPNLGQLLVVYLVNYYSSVSMKKEDRPGFAAGEASRCLSDEQTAESDD
jgi:hypothetical protein